MQCSNILHAYSFPEIYFTISGLTGDDTEYLKFTMQFIDKYDHFDLSACNLQLNNLMKILYIVM